MLLSLSLLLLLCLVVLPEHLRRDEFYAAHPSVRDVVLPTIMAPYIFPEDILAELRQDENVWAHFSAFPDGYKRIRVAYIDAARKRPAEFQRRLASFLKKTRENQRISGFGGIEKYY